MTAIARAAARHRQPLRLAAGLRLDLLHRAGRRGALPAGRGAEGDRRRVRRPPRRAVDGLYAGLLRHGPGRRVHGLAGRPYEPAGAAADRRGVDPARRLACDAAAPASGCSISATCIPLGFLGNAATFTPALNNIQGWFERRRSTAVSLISVGPALSGFIWPQVYSWLLPRFGWRAVAGDLRCRCRRAAVPLRLLCPCLADAAQQGHAAGRGPVRPADALEGHHGAARRRRASAAARHGGAVRAHGGVLRRSRPVVRRAAPRRCR